MKKLNLFNRSGMGPDGTSRKGRYSLDPILSRLCLVSLICLCMLTIGSGNVWGADVTDVITASDLAATGTSYTNFSGVTITSDAVYAGNSALNNSTNIQLRSSNSNSGIVSTTSGGSRVKSVRIVVASGSNTIKVYGKTTAYSAATDLYNNSTRGTEIGSTSSTATLTITGDYTFVGIRSNSGAVYISSIEITWETTAGCSGTALSTPSVTATPSSNKLVLSWPNVDNATKYQVSWNGGVYADATSPFTKNSLSNGTTYTWAVKAIGDGSTWCNSEAAEGSSIPGTYYTVTFMNNGSTYDTKSIRSGQNLVLPNAPSSCDPAKEFVGWATAAIVGYTNTKPTFVSSLTTIGSAQTYYAVFATKTANKYELGAKADLIDGRQVLIVNPSANKAMSGTASSSGKLGGVDVTISSSTITTTDATIIWTVGIKNGNYQFKRDNKFLNSTGNNAYCDGDEDTWSVTVNSSKNILRSQASSKDLECYSGNFYCYNTGTSDYYKMDIYIPEYKNYVTSCASCGADPTVGAASLKGSVSSSSEATAQCTGGITNLGGAGCSITSYGFAVGTSSNPTIGGTLTGTGKTYQVGTTYTTTSTAFEKLIDGLSASTKYYVRPYATNGYGTAYGSEFNFTTLAACTAEPTVTAGSTGTITKNTAVVNCTSGITSLGTGGCAITSYGFAYGTSANPTISGTKVVVGTEYTSTGTSFTATLTGLTEGQTYYVRPYATNGYGTAYGDQVTFGTPKITVVPAGLVVAFGNKKVGGTYTETFTVSGVNLQGNITLTPSAGCSGIFSIDKTSITPTSGSVTNEVITITYTPTTAGSHGGGSVYINVESSNAQTRSVMPTGTGKWEVTWDVSGSTPTTTLVANNEKPTLPDPAGITSCDGTSTTFIGWTKTPWVGKQNQTYIDGLTGDDVVHTDNTTMSNVTANGTTYYAVFAQATTTSTSKDYTFEITTADFPGSGYAGNDGDHNSTATASDASTQTVTWTSSNVCEQSGSIQFKKSSGCLYNGTSYGTIKSVTITSGSNLSHFENSSAQPTGSGTPKNYFQVKAGGSTGTCSKITVVYTASSSTTTYSNYLTTCCNTPTLAFAESPYAVIRQDIQGASTTTWAEVDVTFTSNNTTGTISATTYTSGKTVYSLSTWQSRATTGGSLCATDHAYFEVLTQPSGETPGTGKLHVKTTSGQTGQGTYRISLTQASTDESHGNFCETTVYGFVDVTLRDKFVDKLNDNGTVNKDGHGAQLATPILSELGTQVENACHSEGRKLKGWIKETDLKAQYETGNSTRIYTLDGVCETCTDGSDQTSLIKAPGTNVTMSGATWYAVWAYER